MELRALKSRLLKSNLAQQTVLYGLVNGIASAIPVAVGPILTHYLVPTDYGIASLFTAAYNFVAPLSGLGVQSAVRRRYFQREEYDFPSYVYSSSLFSIAQAGLLTVVAFFTYQLWGTEQVSCGRSRCFRTWWGATSTARRPTCCSSSSGRWRSAC